MAIYCFNIYKTPPAVRLRINYRQRVLFSVMHLLWCSVLCIVSLKMDRYLVILSRYTGDLSWAAIVSDVVPTYSVFILRQTSSYPQTQRTTRPASSVALKQSGAHVRVGASTVSGDSLP